MLKITAVFFLGAGLFLMGHAVMQLEGTHQSEKVALTEIKELLEKQSPAAVNELTFQDGQAIGILRIPGLEKELPIVEGTDEDALLQGVGHFTGTVYPGQNDQILLSGHRDTVFTGLDKLQNGDTLVVEMEHGTFTYAIVDTEIVDAHDKTVIRSTAPKELLTLSTCYPFRYVGNAPQRYIVYAERK